MHHHHIISVPIRISLLRLILYVQLLKSSSRSLTNIHLRLVLALDVAVWLRSDLLGVERALVLLLLLLFRGSGRWWVGLRFDLFPAFRGLEVGLQGLEERDEGFGDGGFEELGCELFQTSAYDLL